MLNINLSMSFSFVSETKKLDMNCSTGRVRAYININKETILLE